MTRPSIRRDEAVLSRLRVRTTIALAIWAGMASACSSVDPPDTVPETADSASMPSGTSEAIDATVPSRQPERPSQEAVGATAQADENEPARDDEAAGDGEPTTRPDDSADGADRQEPEPARPGSLPIEVSDESAPQWPFRGIVQAFGVDADGNGTSDLVVQYHDSTTRTSKEILIRNIGFFAGACRPGIQYDDRELWMEDSRYGIVIPWGGHAAVGQPARGASTAADWWQSPSGVSPGSGSITMAGTRFSVAASRASEEQRAALQIVADGNSASHWASVADSFNASRPTGVRLNQSAWLRGTDGELLAVSYSPDRRLRCSDQRTAVVSLRTGETLACGPHAGDIELVTPAGAGLAVESVALPLGDTLSFDGCDTSLAQHASNADVDGGLFGRLAELPPISAPFAPRCRFGLDQRPMVAGDAVPAAPFFGVVLTTHEHDDFCDEHVITIRMHDARSRATSVVTVSNLQQLPCASHVTSTASGVELYGHQRQDDGGRVQTDHYLLELAWGGQASVSHAGTIAGEPSISHFASRPKLAWYDELPSENASMTVQSHTNGVRISVGEHVGGYVLSRASTGADAAEPALMGRFRLDNSYTGLKGTDGEHVAFAWSRSADDCNPTEVFMLSLSSGDAVACGSLRSGDLLLVSPPGAGVLIDEIRLPTSGWLDRSRCVHGLDEGLIGALESLAPASSSRSVTAPAPDPELLPADTAPQWPYQGVVRMAERYDSATYRNDLVVQFLDADTGAASEIVFAESTVAGWQRDFSVAARGIRVARDPSSGDSLVIPWGEAPQIVSVQTASETGWAPRSESAQRYPTSAALGGSSLEISGYEPWPVGVLRLTHGDAERWYVTESPPAPVDSELELHLGEQSPAWTAHLRGTDGRVAALTYLHDYFDDCESYCGLELTYLISLRTGRVLACGVEPRHSELAFVVPPAAEALAEVVLPPSGWLDPAPCLRGPLAAGRGCSILPYGEAPETRCIREFDLRSIAGGIKGAEVHPATVIVRTRD